MPSWLAVSIWLALFRLHVILCIDLDDEFVYSHIDLGLLLIAVLDFGSREEVQSYMDKWPDVVLTASWPKLVEWGFQATSIK